MGGIPAGSRSAVGPAPVRTHLTFGRFRPSSHTAYFFTSLKKQKEETEEQLEKTQTIQKTKIFIFRALEKKTWNDNVFFEVFEIF